MKIGIDIDDTITNTKEIFARRLKKYCTKNKIANWKEKGNLSDKQFHEFLEKEGKSLYLEMTPKKHAKEVIQSWVEMGHIIYLVTARSSKDCINIEEYTKTFLEKNEIPYQEIIFNSQNKYRDCKKLKLDLFIDDRESVLDTFPKEKIELIRFIPNKNHYSKYLKVESWKELDKIVKSL